MLDGNTEGVKLEAGHFVVRKQNEGDMLKHAGRGSEAPHYRFGLEDIMEVVNHFITAPIKLVSTCCWAQSTAMAPVARREWAKTSSEARKPRRVGPRRKVTAAFFEWL
jgi:hypothetical protein